MYPAVESIIETLVQTTSGTILGPEVLKAIMLDFSIIRLALPPISLLAALLTFHSAIFFDIWQNNRDMSSWYTGAVNKWFNKYSWVLGLIGIIYLIGAPFSAYFILLGFTEVPKDILNMGLSIASLAIVGIPMIIINFIVGIYLFQSYTKVISYVSTKTEWAIEMGFLLPGVVFTVMEFFQIGASLAYIAQAWQLQVVGV